MDYRMFQRKYLLGCLQGDRVQPDYHLTHIVFLFFSVSFSQSLVFPWRLCSKASQNILDIVGLSQAEA